MKVSRVAQLTMLAVALMEPETALYVLAAIASAFAIWGAYRGEILARTPNPDLDSLTKRVDGLYEHYAGLAERVAKVETQIEITVVDDGKGSDK